MRQFSKPILLSALLVVIYTLVFVLKRFLTGDFYQDEVHFYATTLQFARETIPSLDLLRNYGELNTPLPFMIGGVVVNLFGEAIQPLRILTFLISFGIALSFVWAAPKSPRSVLALAGLLLFPNYYLCSVHYYTDMYAQVAVVLGVIAYRKEQHVLSFLCFCLAVCSRQYMIAFPAGIALYEVLRRIDVRQGLSENAKALFSRPFWIWYGLAVLSLVPWILLWEGGAPAAEMARQYYHLGKVYNPGFVLYSAACLAVYCVVPELIFTRSWQYYRRYPAAHPWLFGGLVVFVVCLVLFFPAQQTYNPYFTWPYLGYFDRLLVILGLSGLAKQLVFGFFMLISLMRFIRPRLNVLDWFVLCNLVLLGKAQLSWDKYSMPMIIMVWYLIQFDDYFPLNQQTYPNPLSRAATPTLGGVASRLFARISSTISRFSVGRLARPGLLILLFGGMGLTAAGQRRPFVGFEKLPQRMQVYARDNNNEAVVPISGRVYSSAWSYMSLVVYRNDNRIGYRRSQLQYAAGDTTGRFEFSYPIKAELADYAFEVFLCRGADSVQIVRQEEIVAGDYFVINGQSNAYAVRNNNYFSKYARTIGRRPDQEGMPETEFLAYGWSEPPTGTWGLMLQQLIEEKYKIPTCVINGAVPGTNIAQHLERGFSPENDKYSIYGRLLNRVKQSGATRIRAFFWLQGEDDALGGTPNYPEQFDRLYKMWQADYPNVEQFVVLQINILFNPFYGAGAIREFQRRVPALYPKTKNFATLGLPNYDGIHYEADGYRVLGRQLVSFIAPALYKEADSVNVATPNLQKAYYASPQKNAITLVFEEGQRMRWGADTMVTGRLGQPVPISLRNSFFFDGKEDAPAPVKSGQADGNRVTLYFDQPVTAGKLSYTPAYYTNGPLWFYQGPYLKNSRGLAAFSFQEVAIADPLVIAGFKSQVENGVDVRLSWTPAGAMDSYLLERKDNRSGQYTTMARLPGPTTEYLDKGLSLSTTYTYRLRSFRGNMESAPVEVTAQTAVLLAAGLPADAPLIQLYPTPVENQLNLRFKQRFTGEVQVLSLSGSKLVAQSLTGVLEHQINVTGLPSGMYLVTLLPAAAAVYSQKIVKY
ncbi:hypothetical protein GCM10023187_02410 [Nibrella viscosa]|uniref:Fibronectin type-III domain-containing protein n=1 Tax=Nibrella viscosa TaxID=1084524 RepID=A0ABP8JTF6_9BACT